MSVRDLVIRVSRTAPIQEIASGETITISVQARPDGGSFTTFKTYTLIQTPKGAKGIKEEIPIPSDSVRVRFQITRSSSVDESGPEVRMQAVFQGPQKRKVRSLVGHLDASSRSFVSNDFDDFIDQDTVEAPVFYTPRAELDGMIPVVYNGEYEIDRVTVSDNQDGTSRLRVSMTFADDWSDSGV